MKLQELAEQIVRGIRITPSAKVDVGTYRVITSKNFTNGILELKDNDYFINSINSDDIIIKKDDILISLIGPNFNSIVVINEPKEKLVVANNVAIIKAKNNQYLNTFFNSNTGKKHFLNSARKFSSGVTIPQLSLLNLKNLTIPYFPLDNLNEFVHFSSTSESIYESKIAQSLILKLESIGWEVKQEVRIKTGSQSIILDLALYKNGTIDSFIEIKRQSRNQFAHIRPELNNQLDKYLSIVQTKYCYCFFDGRLLKYENSKFTHQDDFPYPQEQSHSNSTIDFDFFNEVLNENLRLKEELKNKSPIKEILNKLTKLSEEVYIINATTSRTEKKVDSIIHLLSKLSNDFEETKGTSLDIQEKILKLNKQLDESVSNILNNQNVSLADYKDILEQWFSFEWDKFEDLSKSFLPSAEYLFDNLKKLENPDLSPFILQYCRALENEMLNKIFRNYVKSIQNREIEFEEIFAWDLELKENKKPKSESSYRFARHIQKCLKSEESKWFFELGTMRIYLEYLTGKTIRKSPILQDFKDYLLSFFDSNILDAEFLIMIKETTEDYRNKAAHPNKISFEDATIGKVKIKNLLKKFLEMYEYAT